jgi:predicted component of type VI protein secretion system
MELTDMDPFDQQLVDLLLNKALPISKVLAPLQLYGQFSPLPSYLNHLITTAESDTIRQLLDRISHQYQTLLHHRWQQQLQHPVPKALAFHPPLSCLSQHFLTRADIVSLLEQRTGVKLELDLQQPYWLKLTDQGQRLGVDSLLSQWICDTQFSVRIRVMDALTGHDHWHHLLEQLDRYLPFNRLLHVRIPLVKKSSLKQALGKTPWLLRGQVYLTKQCPYRAPAQYLLRVTQLPSTIIQWC